ncbi:MAG: hypothetical protein ABI855_15880 [Bacteroidota bacterium]
MKRIISILCLYASLSNAYSQTPDLDEQLIKSEKMAAFGMMASRVDHEIQNPLNFVNNFSELSKELVVDVTSSTDDDEKKQSAVLLKMNLDKINLHGKHVETIVKQLQEHSNKGTAQEFFEDKDI